MKKNEAVQENPFPPYPFAADSLLKFLHTKLSLPLPQMTIDGIAMNSTARNVDDDIAQTMNLIWKIPHHARRCHPFFVLGWI